MLSIFSKLRAALAVLLVVVAGPSWSAEVLSLDEALALAVSQSRQLRAEEALVSAAREKAVSAGQLPDLVLRLGLDNLPVNGPNQFSLNNDFMTARRIGLMQELPSAEKRQLKAQRYTLEAQSREAQRQVTLSNVRRDTALAWIERYYIGAVRELLGKQLAEARLQETSAELAYRAGTGSQAGVFAVRGDILQLEDQLSATEQQWANAQFNLARWVGSAAQRPVYGAPLWESLRVNEASLNEDVKQQPELQLLHAEIEVMEAAALLAQANKQADWSVEVNYSQRGPQYSDMISFGVSIPLQWDQAQRQDRELAVRLALVSEARERYADQLRRREAEIRGWLSEWQSGKERLTRYREGLIRTSGQRIEAALLAYRIGKGNLSSVVMARRADIDIQIQAVNIEMVTAKAWAKLNFLMPEHRITTDSKDKS